LVLEVMRVALRRADAGLADSAAVVGDLTAGEHTVHLTFQYADGSTGDATVALTRGR
jgi:hypothetical protein